MNSVPEERSKSLIVSKWYKKLKRKFFAHLPHNYKVYLILLFGLFLSIYIFYFLFHYIFFKNHFDPVFGTHGKSCPACFGSKACPYFFRGEVNIKGIYRLPFMQRYNTRQIFESYHGFYRKKTEVVIKKLATHQEHEETDLRICNVNRYRNVEGKCFPKHALWFYLDYHPSKSMQLSHVAHTRNTAPMAHCVTERLFKRILTKFRERDTANVEMPLSRRDEILLLYILNLNQQPLVLQLFPSEEGWPFPKYMGACGRWVIEENAGVPLGNFCNGKIWQKITILLNLLKLPTQLDKSDPNQNEYVLYIGDPDPENFMVNQASLKVKIVDVEHILVVDVKELRNIRLENFDTPYHVKPEPCGSGLSSNFFNCSEAIDKETLCSRESSDHNIHSICAMLLSYSDETKAPACLLSDNRLSTVRDLLSKCVYDENNRVKHHGSIIKELEELLHSVKKSEL